MEWPSLFKMASDNSDEIRHEIKRMLQGSLQMLSCGNLREDEQHYVQFQLDRMEHVLLLYLLANLGVDDLGVQQSGYRMLTGILKSRGICVPQWHILESLRMGGCNSSVFKTQNYQQKKIQGPFGILIETISSSGDFMKSI